MSASLIGPTPPTINRLEAESDGEPPVLYDVDEHGVCIITLNMSRAMNGWGPQLSMGWLDAYDRAQADDAVKVIVVTGRGRAWCAGAAMDGLQDLGASGGLDDGGSGVQPSELHQPGAAADRVVRPLERRRLWRVHHRGKLGQARPRGRPQHRPQPLPLTLPRRPSPSSPPLLLR